MPRFSMDGDRFIPPHDRDNFGRLNAAQAHELDLPVVPLGPRGENFIRVYQTRREVLQFHLGLPEVPQFEEAHRQEVLRGSECGTPIPCLSGRHLLTTKQAANWPQDQANIEFLLELDRLGKL